LFAVTLFISSCGLLNKTRDNNKDKVTNDKIETEIDTLDITQIPESEITPIKKDPSIVEIEDDYSAYKKEVYKIGMLIPFNASDANFDINDGSDQKFVNFYAGAKLALSEFEDQGHKFEVATVDSERSKETVESKLNSGSLENADIIVGPYDRDGLSYTAEYGKEKKVAVISPWLSSTKITDNNPYYIQLRPSLSSHYFKMIDHANQNFSNDEIILVGRDNSSDKNRFKFFQKTYAAINDFNQNDELTEYFITEDSLTYADLAFRGVFEGKNKVAIVLPNWNYNDEDFIYTILRRLNIERASTELYVYGMPIIFDSEKIDFEFYKNLNLRICLSEFVDWEEERVKNFMRRFFENYGALPTSDAFEGYDMMNFIGTNLIKYGINFQLYLEKDRNRYLQTAYDIQKIYEEEDEKFEQIKYLENKHLDLIQFNGNKFVKID
jgi:hypothetical protein